MCFSAKDIAEISVDFWMNMGGGWGVIFIIKKFIVKKLCLAVWGSIFLIFLER